MTAMLLETPPVLVEGDMRLIEPRVTSRFFLASYNLENGAAGRALRNRAFSGGTWPTERYAKQMGPALFPNGQYQITDVTVLYVFEFASPADCTAYQLNRSGGGGGATRYFFLSFDIYNVGVGEARGSVAFSTPGFPTQVDLMLAVISVAGPRGYSANDGMAIRGFSEFKSAGDYNSYNSAVA